MKLDEMKPAPPVTSTRFVTAPAPAPAKPAPRSWSTPSSLRRSKFLLDRVQRASLDVPLDAPERLADQGEHEPLHSEDENNACSGEEGPGEVAVEDPVGHAVDTQGPGRQGAENAEADADP